jgi:1-acyl-sn-glycerol-3-phosphate acyltransferase
MASVERANNVLESGSIIMFPEGTRSLVGEVGKFKRGAFLLAKLSKKKIIPISVAGVELITPAIKS